SCELHRGAGLAQRALGAPQDAIRSLRASAESCRGANDLAGALRSQTNLAIVLVDTGEYREAVRVLLAAIDESNLVQDRELSLALLDNIAVAYLRQGDKEVGRAYLERALSAKLAAGSPAAEIALTRTNLIAIYRSLRRYDEALGISTQILSQGGTLDPRTRATCLVNRAGVYRELRRFAEAAADLEEALRLFQSVESARQAAEVMPHLALVDLERKDNQGALQRAQLALRETRNSGAVDAYRIALDALGMAQMRLGDSAAARITFEEEIAQVEAQRDSLAGNEQQGLQYLATRVNPYYQLMELDVEAKQYGRALSHLEGAKARILVDMLNDRGSTPSGSMTAEEARQEQQLRSRAFRLAAPALQGNAKATEQWQSANREWDAFESTLYARHPELRMRRAAFTPIAPKEASIRLRSGSAAIEFGIVNGKLYSFLLRPGLESITVHVQPWGPVERRIAGFRESIATRDIAYRTNAAELYRLLIGPFARHLKAGTPLLIIPDGALWNIPFAALVSPRRTHLIEEHSLSYAPSLTALDALHSRKRTGKPEAELLATGAPVLGSFAGALSPLHTSAAELKQIAPLYAKAAVLTGSEATKQRWMREAPRHRVLHLSTHGVLNAANPLYSYLVLSDGVLESREILRLTLNADLAVLSACETSRAKVETGEGLVGLTWAFLAAGASTTIASQWKVDAAGTSQLMTTLHRSMRQSKIHADQALQRAATELMRRPEYRHPFYWAPFLVFGSSD
ncbi:MAG: CHAT domain-containing protein, partial [Bryobacterales bacterium]|nr:CHAT domain-containing protein [Bryobacterales bacterium]